jgi:rhamnosyltransferase subunit B
MRIVLSSFGTLGDIHPLIALALELRQRGHVPVLAVPELFRSKIVSLGLEFAPVGPILDPEDNQLVAMLMDIRKGTERTLREILFPAIRQSYRELLAVIEAKGGADLLLAGELVYQAPIVAEVTGIPWASHVLAPLSFFSRYDAPVLPPYPMLARLQPALPGMGRVIAGFARWVTRSWPEPIYQLRSELGLGRGRDPIFEAKHSPSLVLAMFSPLLGEPQPDWPASTKVTGFVFYDGDAGRRDLSSALQQFLEQGPPPLVFTLGSAAVLDAGDFYRESARAAALTGQRAVLLVGSDPRNIPADVFPNVCVANYAPYSKLFPRASVIIHQGGVGTTAQALLSGKPMLVMPYSHDQPDNARRVRRLGVARIIRRPRYTAELAARKITLLVENAATRRKAARIGEQLRLEDGLKAACDALEALGKAPITPVAGKLSEP